MIVFSKEERSEAFAAKLKRQCRLNTYPDEDNDLEKAVEKQVKRVRRDQNIQFTTLENVRNLIRKTKVKKAPGCDQISNRVVRHFTRKDVKALANNINAILRLRIWKAAKVIMLPQMGKN